MEEVEVEQQMAALWSAPSMARSAASATLLTMARVECVASRVLNAK